MDSLLLTPAETAALLLSVKVALWCAAISIVPGVFMGWLLARKSFPGKSVVDSLVHLPLVLPPVVPGYLLLVLLGSQGIVGQWLHQQFGIELAFTWKGAVAASAVMAFPLMVRAVRLSILQIDKALETAARTLGANPLQVFFTITMPLAAPGIITGLILAFSRSLGEFGATITFVGNIEGETRTLPLAIYSYTQIPGGEDQTIRLVIISIVLALTALIVSDRMERQVTRKLGISKLDD